MAPIRVGLVGLSGAPPDKYEGVSWTPNAHLPYLKASPHYEIVALLNSSAESAKAAIARYGLPATTKAYGKPEDLAADDNVDLVVCSTRVDRHLGPVRPSIIAGKSVFVEWPLERNLEVAREMAALAAKHNTKTIVGLQGSYSSTIQKLKELVDNGRIGKILSSSISASMGIGGATEVKSVRYFLDREVGGNALTIRFGHALECICTVLGEFTHWNSLMSNGYPAKDIIDPSKVKVDIGKDDANALSKHEFKSLAGNAKNNEVVEKDKPNSVPDQIMFQGIARSVNAPVTIHFRGGEPFPGTPGMEWRILGTKGEIRLTSPVDYLNVGNADTKIELFDASTEKVEVVVPDKSPLDELPLQAHNIAREYEAFRKGEWYPDFAWAVKRHELIDEMWKQYDARK